MSYIIRQEGLSAKMNKICKQLFLNISRKRSIENYSSCIALGRNFCYKSDLSLDKLYPKSSLKIYTPPPPKQHDEKFSGYIPLNEVQISYSRSSGPGGQHVNCVNTKVDLRFHVKTANWISDKTKMRILNEYKNKISKDGYYVVKSDLTRSQHMNLADALEKLRSFIREIEIESKEPSEETLEKIRRRQERAARERLMLKRNRSQIKADRQTPNVDIL